MGNLKIMVSYYFYFQWVEYMIFKDTMIELTLIEVIRLHLSRKLSKLNINTKIHISYKVEMRIADK